MAATLWLHLPLRRTDRFDDPDLPGLITVDGQLKAVSCGTELNVVQDGITDALALELCCPGWQESLLQLAHLVEPDIPG